MRVLQINATYGYASTGLIVKDIGDMLTENGDEAFFAYQSCNSAPKKGYRIGNKLDWKAHALLCRLSGKQAYYSKLATKELIKHIASIKPDVVHLHNLHSNYVHLNLLLQYLAKEDIATVITLHDCWYFTGKCFHYVDIACDKFQTGCEDCPKKKAPPKSLFFDLASKVLKDRYTYLSKISRIALVGCSQWICEETKKSYLKELPITQIYNGVDTAIFKPYDNVPLREKYQLEEDTYVVMGMANKWLLPSNKQLLTNTVNTLNGKMRLMLVGCMEKQIDYLRELSEKIIPIGFIKEREALAKHYSLANVFVNVTHADTLPTVNMESICCGTPVITYDCCGSPELIIEGCGKVVREYDEKKLIIAINEVMEKIKVKSLEIARLKYDKSECYKKYLQIYRKVLEQKD